MGLLAELYRRHSVYTVLGVLYLILVPITAGLMVFDDRVVDGASVWLKPLKFSASFVTYLFALAFFAAWMRPGAKETAVHRVGLGVVVLAFVYETLWLYSASALGIRSHFNYDGGLFSVLYIGAGIMAIMLVVAPMLMGYSVLRARKDAPNQAMASAICWGLFLTFALTLIAGFPLSMGFSNFGGSLNGYGTGVFGWRMEGGDMRAAHFLATHTLHVVPALAFLPTRLLKGPAGIWVSRLIAGAYAAAVLALVGMVLFRQDLPGFFRMPF